MPETPPPAPRPQAPLPSELNAEFRPTSRRRRLLILLLAVSLVLSVLYLMLGRRSYLFAHTEVAPCAPGQTERCVGGLAEVYVVVPPPAPASAASAAGGAASAASAGASAASAANGQPAGQSAVTPR